LSGIVFDERGGGVVAGAKIEIFGAPAATVMTGLDGSYDTTVSVTGYVFNGTYVTVSKASFEDTLAWIPGQSDARRDIRLYAALFMTAGQQALVPLSGDNSLCGGEDEFQCRTVHIRIAETGTLMVSVTPTSPMKPLWLVADNRITYPFAGTSRLSIPVVAGSEVAVQILRLWTETAAIEATLNTTVAP
jgi:hypothetical protein